MGIVATLRGRETQRHASSRGGGLVACREGLLQHVADNAFRLASVLVEPKLQLRVRQTEFALFFCVQLRAGLEVSGGDPELAREHAESFDRRLPRPRFDS